MGHEESGGRCPPALALERYLANTINNSTSAPWVDHIEGCTKCRESLDQMRADGARYLRSPAAAAARQPRVVRRFHRIAPALAVAAVLVFVFVGQRSKWGSKGTVTFSVVDEAGAEGPFAPGTKVQMILSTDEPGDVCVVAKEPSREISVLAGPVRVDAGAKIRLGDALELEPHHDGTEVWLFFDCSDAVLDDLERDLRKNDDRRVAGRIRLGVRE